MQSRIERVVRNRDTDNREIKRKRVVERERKGERMGRSDKEGWGERERKKENVK